MIKKQIINHLIQNGGELLPNESWVSIAELYKIECPDQKRAKKDEKYKNKTLGRIAQRYWQSYLKQASKLELAKQIYENGQLKWETFKKAPEKAQLPENPEDYEIEGITTNPYGGAWTRLKKKVKSFDEEHLSKLGDLFKDIKPVNYTFRKLYSEKAIFIYGADKHIGALTKLDSIYANKYDREEIKKRLITATLNQIEEWVELIGNPEGLYIMDFGDALDGFNQKTTGGLRGTSSHTLPQQMNNREQSDLYIEVHKELFDIIVAKEYAKDIYFVTTSNSNHGGDFEYQAMRTVEEWLKVRYPFVKTKINYLPFNHFFYGDHCIIFGHGKDEEDMKHGLPLNLTEKVENFINDYITRNNLEDKHVHVITADLHQSSENYGKNFRYKKVLSQYGSSKWMHTNFGSGNPGLTSEVIFKSRNRIIKSDDFFVVENESNTGIQF